MKLKKPLILAVLILALLVLALIVPAASYATPGSAHEVTRPFLGVVGGHVTFTPGSEFGLPPNPNPPFIYTNSSAAGWACPLGKIVMESHHPTPLGTNFGPGHMTLTTANGDEVWCIYTGSAPFPVEGKPYVIKGHVDVTIDGGTGRFAHAKGNAQMTLYLQFPGSFADPSPWRATWTWAGWIRY